GSYFLLIELCYQTSRNFCRYFCSKTYMYPAILIIKIGLLKARLWRAFNKPILVFPAPFALEIPKSVS
ncbi:MAG: hypothetical protein ACK6BS_13460, partial [Pseudanabaena sp.]